MGIFKTRYSDHFCAPLTEEHRHQPARSEGYQYDALYRLVCFKVGNLDLNCTVPLPITQTCYDLDCVGNWNGKTTDGVPQMRTHNEANEILSIDAQPISHDHNGNLNQDERYAYIYDEENRLTSATRLSDLRVVGQYQYDALGRRVAKTSDPDLVINAPVTTLYFYDDARIIEEQALSAVTLATYVYGNYIDEVLTMDRGGTTLYYHQNSLWSVMALTDAGGLPVERYTYDAYGCPKITDGAFVPIADNPWGTPRSAVANPWQFTGRQLDEETGLYFYRARYYDCAKGRFLQRDPAEYVDGLNLYEYVRSKPTRSTDASGLEAISVECPNKQGDCEFHQSLLPKTDGSLKLTWRAESPTAKKGCACWAGRGGVWFGFIKIWYAHQGGRVTTCVRKSGYPTPPDCGPIELSKEGWLMKPKPKTTIIRLEAAMDLQVYTISTEAINTYRWNGLKFDYDSTRVPKGRYEDNQWTLLRTEAFPTPVEPFFQPEQAAAGGGENYAMNMVGD